MGGKIVLARLGQHIDKAMAAHRLQGFSETCAGSIAIVQNQTGAAARGGDARNVFGQGGGGGGGVINGPPGRPVAARPPHPPRAPPPAPGGGGGASSPPPCGACGGPAGTAAGGSATGARAKVSSSSLTVIMRSHQPRSVFTYWRTGSASKNSLATRNSGRSPRLSSNCRCQ